MSAARSRRANDKHNHLQRTPILVMGCSLLIACCIAFGGTNWTASAQPSEDQLPEQNAIVEPGYYQETIGSYEAISQSDDDERAENLRLAAEAINGYVIEPGATFSFNEVVGDTTAERGYKEAPVLYSSGLGSSDGGGICQVSTALYIAAVKADLEIVERHPHSVPSDYAPIGLDATIVYGSRDLRIKNNTDFPITIYAKAVGQTVSVNLLGKPRDDGITIDATSRVVDRYEQATKDGGKQQYYVSESFRVYYKDGVRTSRDLLSSDMILTRSIVGLDERKVLGKMSSLRVDYDTQAVSHYIVMNASTNNAIALPFENAIAVGDTFITVQSYGSFVDANSPASKELVSDSNKLVGVEVYSRTGNTLGTVTTFDFDPVFGAIKSITLDNGSEFKSDAFLFFAPDFVFVDDGSKSAADLRQAEDNTSDAPAAAPASTPATQPAPAAQPAAPAANADGLSNEDALLVDFLIGKTLNDDVANADDTFALPKGTEITREIALDAKKHDALLLLTMSVD